MNRTNVIGFAIALALAGCGSEASWSVDQPSGATAQELFAVRGCRSQERACLADASTQAEATACDQALRACLSSLAAEAGAPLYPDDGGFPTGADDGGAQHRDGGQGGFGGGGSGSNCGGPRNGEAPRVTLTTGGSNLRSKTPDRPRDRPPAPPPQSGPASRRCNRASRATLRR